MSIAVKEAINASIKTNGRQEITGAVMNSILLAMVNDYDSHILDAGSGIIIEEGLIGIDYGIVLDKETAEETYQKKLNPENGILIDSSNNIKLDPVIEMESLDINSETSVKISANDGIDITGYNSAPIALRVRNEDEDEMSSLVLNNDGTAEATGEWSFDSVPRMADENGDYLCPALLDDGLSSEAVRLAGLDDNYHITSTGINIAIVDALPASPDPYTLYFVKEA